MIMNVFVLPTLEILCKTWLLLGLAILLVFSAHLAVLILARRLLPPRPLATCPPPPGTVPEVLVQLPLFNEGTLIEPLLAAITALDWPRERLHIQVLDDSTDDSLQASARAVAAWQAQGVRIELLHRAHRTAFKAGALAAGLARSSAPFVAVFDADFRPPPDFLRRALGPLLTQPELAYVQARWRHLNRTHSFLTRVQARLLDAHFVIEQESRWRLGLLVPFNGTGGVWRRAALDDAGGWQGDTLTEDLDLSLRARLRGWRAAFLADLDTPGMLPETARDWRVQQFRWTKGFVQCFVKLAPALWSSSRLSLWQKLMISLQLAQPLAFLIGTLCLLLGLPFIAGALAGNWVLSLIALFTSTLGLLAPLALLLFADRSGDEGARWAETCGALLLTSGLLLSNARAGAEALLGRRGEFVRTPKIVSCAQPRGVVALSGLPELSMGIGLLGFALLEKPLATLYLAVAIGGLLSMGLLQLAEARPQWREAMSRLRGER